MAWRPAYQPQFPQMRCGRLVTPQWSQELRAARSRVQADAFRLRPLALEVFFFGTAIVGSSEAVGGVEIGYVDQVRRRLDEATGTGCEPVRP